MADAIIEAISSTRLNRANISFSELRRMAGRDHDLWSSLGYGRSILSTCEQLDQYLYSYALMTKAQWDAILPNVTLPNGPLHLIDYGCGQGLGGAILFDHFGHSLTQRIGQVILIEPSSIALQRARAVIDCYLGAQRANTVNKRLDEITQEDIRTVNDLPIVHVLSNVLDIDGFDHDQLFSKILGTVGNHKVLAVSHDRDFYGGSSRFEQLDNAIKDPKHQQWLRVESSTIQRYTCETNKPAISWELSVEVLSGSV